MKKSVKVRSLIFEILFNIYQKSANFDESYNNLIKNVSVSDKDKSMIFNVVLNSMRNNFYITYILNKYLKKRTSTKIKILLTTSITQIFYLGFKDYAVTNDTVEVAKIKRLNPGFVNSLLKSLIKDIHLIKKNKIDEKKNPYFFT